VDTAAFFPEGEPADPRQRFVVVSYGGRNARWKGFAEAAEAIRLARAPIPTLEWRVFGDALLPPENPVAPYRPLGFITGSALRRAYSEAHALLAPSWYESFPLFPLEAMACGTAVVTTPFGTEDYVRARENALVVPAREPQAMAAALAELYEDGALRRRLGAAGIETARRFTWERSVARMAELLRI
jgi:glycosyltransferase involved in cell wall biosynthesis